MSSADCGGETQAAGKQVEGGSRGGTLNRRGVTIEDTQGDRRQRDVGGPRVLQEIADLFRSPR